MEIAIEKHPTNGSIIYLVKRHVNGNIYCGFTRWCIKKKDYKKFLETGNKNCIINDFKRNELDEVLDYIMEIKCTN